MGTFLNNKKVNNPKDKGSRVSPAKNNKKINFDLREWTKEQVEADRSKAYKYAI